MSPVIKQAIIYLRVQITSAKLRSDRTVKLTRAKLHANASNFTRGTVYLQPSQDNLAHASFTVQVDDPWISTQESSKIHP